MNLVRVCHENRKAIYLLTALMVIGGLFALFQLPSNIYPELSFPRVVVLVHTGDLAPIRDADSGRHDAPAAGSLDGSSDARSVTAPAGGTAAGVAVTS